MLKREKRFLLFLSLLLSFTLLLAGCSNNDATPTEEPYTVSGTLSNISGEGIGNEKIIFSDSNGYATTNADGNWTKSGLTGEVTITTNCNGLPNKTTVTDGKKDINFIKCNTPKYTVDTNNINKILKDLTSEKMNGRLPGTDGNKEAEKYIATYFNNLGLKNPSSLTDYRQTFSHPRLFQNTAAELNIINVDGTNYKNYVDFMPVHAWDDIFNLNGEIQAPVFLYKNKDKVDAQGKIMMISNETRKNVGIYGIKDIIVENSHLNLKGVIIEWPHPKTEYYRKSAGFRDHKDHPGSPIVFAVTSPVYKEIKDNCITNNNELFMQIDCTIKNVDSNNIIGYIEGENTSKSILVSAHFDHVGRIPGGPYIPGAGDNASGTATMMEIARIIKTEFGTPNKNIVFIGFNAEELPFIGSEYYVKQDPLFPLENSQLINLDSIGLIIDKPLWISRYNEEDPILRNQIYNILNVGFKNYEVTKYDGGLSDETAFENTGTKATTILHAGSIGHTPNDTIDRLNLSRMETVVRAVITYIYNEAYSTP